VLRRVAALGVEERKNQVLQNTQPKVKPLATTAQSFYGGGGSAGSKPPSIDVQNGSAYRSYRFPLLREALLTLFTAMVDIVLNTKPFLQSTVRNTEMRVALPLIMTGHGEMEADIKTLHAPPHLGNPLHTTKAMPVRPTTFHLIRPTPNSL
jgi:hypothetical protein